MVEDSQTQDTQSNGPNGPERRRYPRQDALLAGQLIFYNAQGHRQIVGKIRDVSPSGLSFESNLDKPPELGTETTVVWVVPPHMGFAPTPKKYRFTGTVVRQITTGDFGYTLGIRLSHLIPEQIKQREARPQREAAVAMAIVVAALVCFLKVFNILNFWWAPFFNAYSLLVCAYILVRVAVSMFYKEPVDRGDMPSVSVVMSAKNEEEHIEQTVRSIFASRYPANLMEVLLIDDGSTDRTWERMIILAGEFPRLRLFRHAQNLGKRQGMALGAKEAKHSIVVYVDSDSVLQEEAIYRMVQAFHDPGVGAVAGQVSVIVEPDNFFSKMEVVRYLISQRVIKASEGLFNSVMCVSGPLAAYRRVTLLRVLPDWLTQTFAGTRATFGDDRSLTNYVLRTHRVVYHHGAVCNTFVPRTWRQYFKQQLRWKKSWARETYIAATSIMWKKHPLTAIPFYVGIFTTLLSPIVAVRALFYLPVFLSVSSLPYIIGLFLINVLLASVFYYYTRSRYWPYLLAFVVTYIAALSWQTYYAILTVRKNQWGTR